MKITDWKELYFAIAVGGSGFVFNIIRRDWVLTVFCACFLARGLWLSFSHEAYAESEKKRRKEQVLQQNVFGAFAPLVDFVPLVCILLAWLLTVIFSQTLLLRIALGSIFIFMFGFMIWESYVMGKEREKSESSETTI